MNTKKIKDRKIGYFVIIIVSILTAIFCGLSLLDYSVQYKYQIDDNYDHKSLTTSYDQRKIEIDTIILYLKFFISYLLIITIYFLYKLFSKKTN